MILLVKFTILIYKILSFIAEPQTVILDGTALGYRTPIFSLTLSLALV